MNTVVLTLMPFIFALILVNASNDNIIVDLPGSHLSLHDPSQENSPPQRRKANKSASINHTSTESLSVVKVKHDNISDKKDNYGKKLTIKDQFISAPNHPSKLPTTSKNDLRTPSSMEGLDHKENIKGNNNESKQSNNIQSRIGKKGGPSHKENIKVQTYNGKPKAKIKNIEQQANTNVTDGKGNNGQENNKPTAQATVTATDNKDIDKVPSSKKNHSNKAGFINRPIERKNENEKGVKESNDGSSRLIKQEILNNSTKHKVKATAGGRTLTANIHSRNTTKRPLETYENVLSKEEANISNKTVKQTDKTDIFSTSQTLPSVVTTLLSFTLTRQSSQSTKIANGKSSIILSVVSSTSSTLKQDHESFSRGSSEKCTFLRNDNLEYTRSSVIAAAVVGMTFGGFIVFFLFYARGRCKRYVQGDYRRVPMEYDFELNPRFKTH